MPRKTKIVCTLGPACDDPAVLKKMVSAGMNVARLNLSHGDHAEHQKRIDSLRALSDETAIIADLQGPRIRTGAMRDKQMEIATGAIVTLTSENIPGQNGIIPISPASVIADIKPGHLVLLVDGTIKLKVTAKKGKRARCRVIYGGTVGEHKGVNLPHTSLRLPSLTPKDKLDVELGGQAESRLHRALIRQETGGYYRVENDPEK